MSNNRTIFVNSDKNMENIWGPEDCNNRYELKGFHNYIADIKYSAYEIDGRILEIDNGGHGYYKWRVFWGSSLIGEFSTKRDCTNFINK